MPTPRSGSLRYCGQGVESCCPKDSKHRLFIKDKDIKLSEQIFIPTTSRFAADVVADLDAIKRQFNEFMIEQKRLHDSIVSLRAAIPKSFDPPVEETTDQPELETSPNRSRNAPLLENDSEMRGALTKRMSVEFGMTEEMHAKSKEGIQRIFQYRIEEEKGKGKVNAADMCLGLRKASLDLWIDSAMGFVIVLNAIMIGVQMDLDEVIPHVLEFFDKFFLISFCVEMVLKIVIHGLPYHFCGPHKRANFVDLLIILVDVIQQSMAAAAKDNNQNKSLSPFFRLVRILKLIRLVRLLRSDVFKDLLSMVQGFSGSMATLGWSMVLFFFVIYVYALIFRELFGRREDIEQINPYFDTVPRSMLTMFRCGFGDCSSENGPILEDVLAYYSWGHILLYGLFTFTVCIGVFNVISAIFVESILSATLRTESAKKKARLSDEAVWCKSVETIIRNLVDRSSLPWPDDSVDLVDEIISYELPVELLGEAVKEPAVAECLLALDLDPDDNAYLADIMDPDNGGTINVLDLVEGLRRLRGDPRRSDIVTVDLMIRSMQKELRGLKSMCEDLAATIGKPAAR